MLRMLLLVCAILLAFWAQVRAQDEPVLVDWKKPIERDGITIKVIGTARGKVKCEEMILGVKRPAELEGTVLTIEVTNTNKNRKNDGNEFFFLVASDANACTDNLGNKYYTRVSQLYFAGPRPVAEKIARGGLYPNKTNTEVLVFQMPVDAAKTLTFRLGGTAYEGKGKDQIITIPIEEFKEAK